MVKILMLFLIFLFLNNCSSEPENTNITKRIENEKISTQSTKPKEIVYPAEFPNSEENSKLKKKYGIDILFDLSKGNNFYKVFVFREFESDYKLIFYMLSGDIFKKIKGEFNLLGCEKPHINERENEKYIRAKKSDMPYYNKFVINGDSVELAFEPIGKTKIKKVTTITNQ